MAKREMIRDPMDIWRDSYAYLPYALGDDDICDARTEDLTAALHLMEMCEARPPQFEFPVSDMQSRAAEEDISSWFERSVVNESLRYPRVCRELATRTEMEDATRALDLLRAALLPEEIILPLGAAGQNATLEEWSKWSDMLLERLQAVLSELAQLSVDKDRHPDDPDLHKLWVTQSLAAVALHSMLLASRSIEAMRDTWNFRTKVSILRVLDRVDRPSEAAEARKDCILALEVSGELFDTVLDGWLNRAEADIPIQMATASGVGEFESALSRAIRTQLEPLLKSIDQNLTTTQTVHDRLDLIFEKLIDLDQRSELTWQEIKQSARLEPDYSSTQAAIEGSLSDRLGPLWDRVAPASRRDLIDADYIYDHCGKADIGWRMAVMGYCTTAERELKTAYRALTERIFGVSAGQRLPPLGDLIRLLEDLQAQTRTSKRPPELTQLMSRLQDLQRLVDLRNRAAHPDEIPLTRKDATWVRKQITSSHSDSLICVIVSNRSK